MAAKVTIIRTRVTTKTTFNNPTSIVKGIPKAMPNKTLVTRITFTTPKTSGNTVRTKIKFRPNK